MTWREAVTCCKYNRPFSIPEQDRVRISVLQKPFEEVIYNRMLRLSYENSRNFCRISYAALQETTSLRSKNAVITGIQGLIEKRHIIKLLNEEGRPEMNREGTLYRVLSPGEALRGVLDDGMIVSEIDRDGVSFTVQEKKIPDAVPDTDSRNDLIAARPAQDCIPQGNTPGHGERLGLGSLAIPAMAMVFGILITLFTGYLWQSYGQTQLMENNMRGAAARETSGEKAPEPAPRSMDTVEQGTRSKPMKQGQAKATPGSLNTRPSETKNRKVDTADDRASVQKNEPSPAGPSGVPGATNVSQSKSASTKITVTQKPVAANAGSIKPIVKDQKAKSQAPIQGTVGKKTGAQNAQKAKSMLNSTKMTVKKPISKQSAPAEQTSPDSGMQEKPLTIIE